MKKQSMYYVVDIDGCLNSGKDKDLNLPLIEELKRQIFSRGMRFSLCTGRSAPYVEAFGKMLGLNSWSLCENGAYLYDSSTGGIVLNKNISSDAILPLSKTKDYLVDAFSGISQCELGKSYTVSLTPKGCSVEELYSVVVSKKSSYDSLFEVRYSSSAVDFTPIGVNKKSGFEMLREKINYSGCYLGVGDSYADALFMDECDFSACPYNADDFLKKEAGYVSPFCFIEGVLDIVEKHV